MMLGTGNDRDALYDLAGKIRKPQRKKRQPRSPSGNVDWTTISTNAHHAHQVDRTALVDFVACPSPQHRARTFVVVRLYTDAQELFAPTEAHTHLSIRAQPFTTRNGTSCGYKEFLYIGTPWSFFVCVWYKARIRARCRRWRRAAAVWVTYVTQIVSVKDDLTLAKPPTEEPFRVYTPGRFLEVR